MYIYVFRNTTSEFTLLPFCFILTGASFSDEPGGLGRIFVAPGNLFVGCIVGLDVYHISEYCFSSSLINSPQGNNPNGNYFLENACVRFLFSSSEEPEDERLGTGNE